MASARAGLQYVKSVGTGQSTGRLPRGWARAAARAPGHTGVKCGTGDIRMNRIPAGSASPTAPQSDPIIGCPIYKDTLRPKASVAFVLAFVNNQKRID